MNPLQPDATVLGIVTFNNQKYVGRIDDPNEIPDVTNPVLLEAIQFETGISPNGTKVVTFVQPPFGVPEEILFPNNISPMTTIRATSVFGQGYMRSVSLFKQNKPTYLFTEKH